MPVTLLVPDEATPGNPEWHKLRRAGISASEIAAVMGISPWESAFSLFWSKLNGWTAEETPEMTAGKRAEPVIADWFAAECDPHGNLLVERAGLYAHDERPWQLATPDRLVYLPCPYCESMRYRFCEDCDTTGVGKLVAVLECKYVVYNWDGWGEDGSDDIPVYYRAQVLWQMDVLGVDTGYLAAWHGAEFRCYVIRRDEKDLRVMRGAARRFLDQLESGEAPPLDGHTATLAALRKLHPSIEDVEVEVPVEFAEGYRRARELRRRADAAVDRYEARARDMLGNGRRLVCGGRLVVSRSVFDRDGDMAQLDSLDGDPATVDRLNPGRAASYA